MLNGKTAPHASLRKAKLHYVSDRMPGIRRVRRGRGFVYLGPRGDSVRHAATQQRIRSLAIPPAWQEVWICSDPQGHLQATGRDARGRKQYRYHPRWRELRDQEKFGQLHSFAKVLPRLRRRVAADLAQPGLPKSKVLAIIVRLLDTAFLRVGNESYAQENGSFGLTTLRNRHAQPDPNGIRLRFRAKSGKLREVAISDPRLARLIRRCRELPGQQLFEYLDDSGQVRPLGSSDVNAYLQEISGADFTSKDFRTWAGTLVALRSLLRGDPPRSQRGAQRRIQDATRAAADTLGNTPAICRNCYIHPALYRRYLDDPAAFHRFAESAQARTRRGLRSGEAALAALVRAG